MSTVITETEAKTIVAANVAAILEDRGLSQKELADAAKMNTMAVSRLVRGEVEPTAAILANVAEALKVSVDFLLGKNSAKSFRRREKPA